MQQSVLVINVFEKPTAIWLYSRNLMRLDEYHMRVYDAFPKRSGISSRLTREIEMMSDAYLPSSFLKRQISKMEYDIIHYADPMVPPISDSKFKAIPIVTIHDNPKLLLNSDYYFPKSLTGKISKKFLKRNIEKYKDFPRLLAISDYTKNSLIDYGFTGEIDTIYHPVSPYFKHIEEKYSLRKALSLPVEKKLILSVSTDTRRKNLALLESAMKKLDQTFALVRVGKSVGNSISFFNVDNEKLNMIYNACDLLAVPSFEEGQGLPVIEALAIGIPVVASDIEVFHEIGGEALEYIDPYSVDSLVSGIKNALALSDSRITLGYKTSQKFSYEIFKDKMLGYYNRLGKE